MCPLAIIISYHIISYRVISYRIISYPIISYGNVHRYTYVTLCNRNGVGVCVALWHVCTCPEDGVWRYVDTSGSIIQPCRVSGMNMAWRAHRLPAMVVAVAMAVTVAVTTAVTVAMAAAVAVTAVGSLWSGRRADRQARQARQAGRQAEHGSPAHIVSVQK